MANTGLPLSRFTVLDLTGHRAGPTAVRQLADWGAKVVKIEPPGSNVDATGGSRDSPDFQNLHRNKRSLTLNLKDPEGHAIFMKMARTADVVVENMRSDVKHRLKVDYDSVRKINPRVVYGSIAGFGQDGPYATRPGVDQIAQGMGGLMSITGFPDGPPTRVGIAIADLTSGLFLAQGILIALLNREVTGEGQWVHTSLLESQIFMLDFQAARWLIKKEVAGRAGNDHPTGAPTGMVTTADGYYNIAPTGPEMWKKFCPAIGKPELLNDPRFTTNELRVKNREALNSIISEAMVTKPSAYWLETLDKLGIPSGPVNTIDQTFADPQVKHLGIAKPAQHPRLGRYEVVGQPIHLTGSAPADIRTPAPDAGEHTDEVLREYGFDANQIGELRKRKVV